MLGFSLVSEGVEGWRLHVLLRVRAEVGPVRECKALAQKLSGRDSSGQIGQFGLLGALIMGSKEELQGLSN